ncbi:sugar transferase [Cellulophaga sp. F20128]|uniref:sugar transferase n=1 Tax=Cellulophaga sp. F20128 TaxID=2926413 RepID=UPI001FF2D5B9|nr:sugar transferase [Cellulophaga sp. F20128]MCK0158142.1 sugar transferase [Cellulophaga sp. F20128]
MNKPAILNSIERKFILLVGDILIILAALNVLINFAIDDKIVSFKTEVIIFILGLVFYLLLAYILDFYNLEKVSKKRYLLSQSFYISGLYVVSVFVITVLLFDISFWRIPLFCFLFLTPIEIGLWRFFYRNIFNILPVTKNVLYVYEEKNEASLKDEISIVNGKDLETFYKVKLTLSVDKKDAINKKSILTAAGKIDTWIINTDSYNNFSKDLEKVIIKAMLKGKEVISYTSFYENTYEALPIESHNDSFYEILQFRNIKIRYLLRIFSFITNSLLAFFVGLFFVLTIPFVYFFNFFFNKGPLFYKQKRVGLYGKEFDIYKYRSMITDAEKSGAKMAVKNDARITPFGKILRLFRIDELPQIISVMKGDMQFIGPRPERKIFVKELNKIVPFYNVRHLIKPGITGWAQVKYKYGENLEDSIRKLEYDMYYIKNRSITLDLKIIFKTITTVLFSRGV